MTGSADPLLWSAALHEAAHVVVAYDRGVRFSFVRLAVATGGRTFPTKWGSDEDIVWVALAGAAADHELSDLIEVDRSRCAGDFDTAVAYAKRAWGDDHRLGIERTLKELKPVVRSRRRAIEAVASALVERQLLLWDEAVAVIEAAGR